MTEVRGRLYIEPPEVSPRRFGLLGATRELDTSDPHWLHAGVEWESLASYAAMDYPAGVYAGSGIGGSGGTKTLPNNLGLTTAWPFAIFAGVDCGTIGRPQAEYEERARAILELARQSAMESALWTAPVGNSPGLNAASTPVITASVGGLRGAVSALEQYMATRYNARAFLYARVAVAAYASFEYQLTIDPDNHEAAITAAGSRWVFGGGFDGTGPNAVAPIANKEWIYATGQPIVGLGDVSVPANFDASIKRTVNRNFLIAEQPALIGVDGPIVACQATLA